jgi:flagellar biosynthetic protein FlhB
MLAVLDYGFQRWQFEKRLMMTKQEVKEEFKQTEGDPLIKSRVKSLQREMARKRMMADVPKADVVITNPTELAVALRYHSGEMDAPKVLAKGAGFLAAKIRELAKEHGVAIVEDKPLAQALYKSVEVGQSVPYALYAAVAEVLAYVYRLKGRRPV